MGPTGYGTGQLDPVDDDIEAADGSEEIEVQKAEIAHTRTNMAETLDAIKDKLDPQAMMEQAKEKVTTAASDVMDKAKATVHEVASDVVGQAKEVPQATVDAAKGAVSDAAHAVKDTFTSVGSVAGKAGGTVVDTVKANPIPYLLIGLGAGWLYWSSRQNSYRAPETRYITTQPTTYAEYDADATYGGTGRMDRTRESGGSAVGAVKEKVGGAADSVKGAVTGAADTVKDKAGQLAGQAQGTAQQLRSQVMSGVEQAQGTFQTTLETNPLAIGAVALGIGLGLGMLLPETNTERQVMGEARDRVGDKVQQTARELSQKAQTVAKESLDAAKEAAKDAVNAPA